MLRESVILFVCLLLSAWVKAQASAGSTARNTGTSTDGRSPALVQGTSPKALLPVLFATNEGCRLFINEEEKAVLSKDRYFHLALPAGNYRYIVKLTTTGEEWRDTFSVAEGKINEVFLDVLFLKDLAAETKSKMAAMAASQPVAAAKGRQAAPAAAGEQKQIAAAVNEQSTLTTILANMIPIQGGIFVMGNNKSPAADEAEHPVLLSNFHMSRYEVTQQQWQAIMGYNPSLNKGCGACPVENVSWEDVMVFVRKLSSLSNRKFRLPTEAEWEYVAKMGGKEEIDRAGGTEAFIKNSAWAFVNSENKTHPVGKKQPTAAGMYDLIGNVSEWCMDWYGAFFYKEDFTEKDPGGPPLGKEKVVRGGNYKDSSGDRFRPSFRNKINPKNKGSEIGFRLVMERQE